MKNTLLALMGIPMSEEMWQEVLAEVRNAPVEDIAAILIDFEVISGAFRQIGSGVNDLMDALDDMAAEEGEEGRVVLTVSTEAYNVLMKMRLAWLQAQIRMNMSMTGVPHVAG